MKQSQDTPKDTSPNLDLIREVGDRAMERLMQEFQVQLKTKEDNSSPKEKESTESSENLPEQTDS